MASRPVTYNTTKRRRFTKQQRQAFLLSHGSRCYWCGEPITEGQPWAIEHKIPRELMPGKEADADHNLAPIHSHPMDCHKIKTRIDIKAISKSNRIRKNEGFDEVTRKPPPRMKGRSTFGRPGQKRPWPKRPFQARRPA